ncbi:RmlC-like cupin [Phlegmacium glaucopus]|nr:RmlC-like cupin [Phlegmacium glaucopus]
MALAITSFHGLCGFRPLPEIAYYLNNAPELKALILPPIINDFLSISGSSNPTGQAEKAALKNIFTSFDDSKRVNCSRSTRSFSQTQATQMDDDDIVQLVLRLNEQFPGDIGLFCPFVLNYVRLDPGQAIFLGAGEPHAYIPGECIECMANSDNVIRAGLTPKLRDIPNLISNLTYTASPPSKHVVEPKLKYSVPTLYDPPYPNF